MLEIQFDRDGADRCLQFNLWGGAERHCQPPDLRSRTLAHYFSRMLIIQGTGLRVVELDFHLHINAEFPNKIRIVNALTLALSAFKLSILGL